MSNIIECRSVSFSYNEGNNQTSVLKNLNFEIKSGETTAIIGQSGCGKSTLLNLMAGLDTPTNGDVLIANTNISKISEKDRTELRAKNLGFVYQFHHLLGEFSALENVAMPLLIGGCSVAEARERATVLLERVGLGSRLSHQPAELSGGERQRVAVARALVTEPSVVLMDEPTGNLDPHTAASILALLIELNHSLAISFVLVTHDRTIAAQMDRTVSLEEGKLVAMEQPVV